jgi:gliding motility-associated-like protein
MKRLYLILWHILFLPLLAFGQNCGLEDTLWINPNSFHTFEVEITEIFNDDLSSPEQGICGIEIEFVHQFSENLELWVVSPGGDTVQLIGPNTDDQLAFTFFAKWKISFVSCADNAMPDPGFPAQWTNDGPNNFVSGGQYTGSYYPYSGCLENFDSGPVNGIWQILVRNDPSAYAGAILDFRLVFCDLRGLDCCFAYGGEMPQTEILACCDTSLVLNIPPEFSGNMPDTAEYGYTYLITDEFGVLIAIDSIVDLGGYGPGNYQICGLSYRKTDFDSLPIPDGILAIDSLNNDLESFFPSFCGSITTDCTPVTLVEAPPPTELSETICEGESVTVGDSTFTQTGTYSIILPGYGGCDSLIILDLVVIPPSITNLAYSICEGETVIIGTSVYSSSGQYMDSLTGVAGCDSIVFLNLTVLQPVDTFLDVTICSGESFQVGSSIFSETGLYEVLLTASFGCDSTVTLDLQVLEPEAAIAPPDIIDCYNGGITLDGTGSSPAGSISFEWTDIDGNFLGATPTLPVEEEGAYILNVYLAENGVQCVHSDTVEVVDIRVYPTADAGPPETLTCIVTEITLGGPGASQGPDITYLWTTDTGSFVSATDILDARVNAPGLYTLLVTDITNGCADISTVLILENTTLPPADAGVGFEINCTVQNGTLDGSGSAAGPDIIYEWMGPCILSDPALPQIDVDCPGIYVLRVENTETGCFSLDTVTVTENFTPAIADAGPTRTLTCETTEVTLDGSGSTPAGDIAFQWSGPCISGGGDTSMPIVDCPGLYTLIATHQFSNCADTAQVQVLIDTIPPVADAGPDVTVTCAQPTAPIGGPGTSTGPEFIYEWFTTEGSLTGPTDMPFATADTSGVYVLSVTNTVNGCTDTSVVTVIGIYDLPFANAGPDREIDCKSDEVTLDGSGSQDGTGITYLWSGPCLLTDPQLDTIVVNCHGIYTLTVFNENNGCFSIDTVEVLLDSLAPVAVVEPIAQIDCQTGMAQLNATGSSPGAYQWLFEDMPTSLTGLNPSANMPGLYTLVVSSLDISCTDTAFVEVILDCEPFIIIADPLPITCNREIVSIDASASTGGPQVTYTWIAPDPECIFSGQSTPVLNVTCGGTYTLILTNTSVQLSDTLSVEVEMNTQIPVAEAGPPDTLTCTNQIAFLDGSASSIGPNIVYLWTNFNGDTLSTGLTASVNEVGPYFLEVTDTSNMCRSTDIVQVVQDATIPAISFGSSVFPCTSDTFALQAFVSPPGNNYTYNWSGPGIVADADSLTALIDTIGHYVLVVTNTTTNCSSTRSVYVTEQTCIPCLETQTPDTLDCLTDSVILQADFCEPCPGCVVEWSTSNGTIDAQIDSMTIVAVAPGIYVISATDTLGFTSTRQFIVIQDTISPIADAGPDRSLTCDSTTVTLGDPDTSTGSLYVYRWSAESGGLPPDPDSTLFASVSLPGTYFFEVRNTQTGCIGYDTVAVVMDTIPPVAEAGPEQSLTCQAAFVTLDGTGSSVGNNITYLWTSADNFNITGHNSLNPIVTQPGLYYLTVENELNGCLSVDSVWVNSTDELPHIPDIQGGVIDCLDSVAVLTAEVSDTVGHSFSWCRLDAGGQVVSGSCRDSLSINVAMSGNYRFSLTNELTGCTNSKIVIVQDLRQLPDVDAGVESTLLCSQNSMQLSGSAGPAGGDFTFQWNGPPGAVIDGDNTLTPTIYIPGIYTLTVLNNNNQCAASDSVTIAQDTNQPEAEAGPDSAMSCLTANVVLSGSGSSAGGGQLSFSWTTVDGNIVNGGATATPTVNQPGVYYFTVIDQQNNCSATDSVTVADNRQPPTAQIDFPVGATLNCETDTISVNASASTSAGGTPLSFNWSVVSVGNIIGAGTAVQIDAVGSYRLIVTDAGNGCRDTVSFQVAGDFLRPVVNIVDPLQLTCVRTSLTLDASGSSSGPSFQYIWTDSTGSVLPDTTLTPVVNAPGVYSLTIMNRDNGCTREGSAQVDIDTIAPVASIAQPEALDCAVLEIELDGSASTSGPGITYLWTTTAGELTGNQNAVIAGVTAPGVYQLLVADSRNGCADTALIEVIQMEIPITGVAITALPPDCTDRRNGSITIDSVSGGIGPFAYSLDGNFFSTFPLLENLTEGTYLLQIQDVNGCEWLEEVVVPPAEEIIVDLGLDVTIELGDSVRLEAIVNFDDYQSLRWEPASAFDDPASPVQIVRPQETSVYQVTVVKVEGCRVTDRITVNVVKPRSIFIPNIFSPNGDGQNDVFFIYAGPEVLEIHSFKIFDRWGNQVFGRERFQPNDPTYGWDGNFEGRPMNAAVFAFFAEIEFIDGRIEMIKGDVTLMR